MKSRPERMARWLTSATLTAWVGMSLVSSAQNSAHSWWAPGDGAALVEFATYENDRGHLGVLNTSGRQATKGHPFFEAIGSNGRACVTCHQPVDGMALSVRSVRARWEATRGKD